MESHGFRNLALEKTVKSFELHDGVMRNLTMKTAPFSSKQELLLILATELLYAKNTPLSLVVPICKGLNQRTRSEFYKIKMTLELFLSVSESLGRARGCTVALDVRHSCSPFAHRSTGTNGESGMQLPRGTKSHGMGQKESGTAAA